MESSLGLQSSSHLPHCEYAILPMFLYYLLKIKMCLCVGGMRMTAGASSLEFESILNVPGPMCFSRLTSPLRSVLNKHLANLPLAWASEGQHTQHHFSPLTDSGVQRSLQLAPGCRGARRVFQGTAITTQATRRGAGAWCQRGASPGPFPQEWSSALAKGKLSWQETKVGSEYPPEGPEAGQMLGKSQLIKKEPVTSLFFFE